MNLVIEINNPYHVTTPRTVPAAANSAAKALPSVGIDFASSKNRKPALSEWGGVPTFTNVPEATLTPSVSFIDPQAHCETIDWFKDLIAMAQLSNEASVFA